MAVCTKTDLPLAWDVRTAKDNEANYALSLIDMARERGFAVETATMNKGYDYGAISNGCAERDCLPVIPLRETTGVKKGWHKPPTREHGEWRFAGADYGRKAAKWRCPTGECKPASHWVKADRLHPLIPRETLRYRKLYRGRERVAYAPPPPARLLARGPNVRQPSTSPAPSPGSSPVRGSGQPVRRRSARAATPRAPR
jgi:hypothetical protein